jgi:catechol 2,3-dioxygenase-like lactoylglutathione lyase family enzyme
MSDPKFTNAAPTFLVDDVAATAEWYGKHLGFTANFFPGQPPYVFASLMRDQVEIMLLRLEGYHKPVVVRPAGNWDAYIRMQGVREFYDAVRQNTPIKMELKKQSYGNWEFEVVDPNGYVLVFGE